MAPGRAVDTRHSASAYFDPCDEPTHCAATGTGILRLARDIRQEIAQLAADYAIKSAESNLVRTIMSEFTLMWCNLEDIRPLKLRNYGVLNPHVNELLGPHIQHLIDLTLTIDRVANNQRDTATERTIGEKTPTEK